MEDSRRSWRRRRGLGNCRKRQRHLFLSSITSPSYFTYTETVVFLDFTKQYNRLKQHNTLSSGQVRSGTGGSQTTTGILPAINRPKPKPKSTQPTTSADRDERRRAIDKTVSDQLTALSKYTSRIASIHEPYARPPAAGEGRRAEFTLGVSVNRKGPSAQANQKDKADRATNEQVLDPRTRIILFKMIRRELIKEINGCVSTGKEVRRAPPPEGRHASARPGTDRGTHGTSWLSVMMASRNNDGGPERQTCTMH